MIGALGEAPTTSVEEINSDPVYEAEEISKEEFENLWNVRRSARIMTPFPLDNGGDEPD